MATKAQWNCRLAWHTEDLRLFELWRSALPGPVTDSRKVGMARLLQALIHRPRKLRSIDASSHRAFEEWLAAYRQRLEELTGDLKHNDSKCKERDSRSCPG